MNFNPLDSIAQTSVMMDMIAQKQKVLSTNLANMDTPGYNRKDVDFAQLLGTAGTSPLETKLSSKLGTSGMIEAQTGQPVKAADELIAMQNNSILYSIAARRISTAISSMRTVLSVGK